jgi:hypothetical protein
MKNLLLLLALTCLTSCGSFGKPIVKKASDTAKELSVKHLGCSTGDAVFIDVEKQMEKMLKVKSSGHKSVLAGTLCTLAVKPVVESLIDLGNKQLPDSWIEDGCSLDGFSGDASELADKLCNKL